MTKMDLTVVLLQYNKANLTIDCLESLLSFYSHEDFDIVVGDNDSNNDEKLKLSRYLSGKKYIKHIEFQENHGFAKAHNLMIKKLTTKYVLLLNNDTLILDDGISKIYNYIKDCNNAVGTCTLLNPDLTYQENCSGYFGFPAPVKSIYFNLKNKIFPNSEYKLKSYCNGAFLMIEREQYNLINGFNEDLFMYSEDLDLMIKLNKCIKNFKVLKFDNVRTVHIGGASSAQKWDDESKALLQIRQGNKVVKMHYGYIVNFVVGSFYGAIKLIDVLKEFVFFNPKLAKLKFKKIMFRLFQ